jgi:hypothetical protein
VREKKRDRRREKEG